jgi:hypothetical protein
MIIAQFGLAGLAVCCAFSPRNGGSRSACPTVSIRPLRGFVITMIVATSFPRRSSIAPKGCSSCT